MDRRSLLMDPETRRIYEQEYLFGEATETVGALLEDLGLSRADLARRLGVTRGRITQILSGKENLTLKTLADLGWALGVRFNVDPQLMELRAGTPAADDPALPAWVERIRHSTLRIHLAAGSVWPENQLPQRDPVWTLPTGDSAATTQTEVAA